MGDNTGDGPFSWRSLMVESYYREASLGDKALEGGGEGGGAGVVQGAVFPRGKDENRRRLYGWHCR